MDGTNTQLSADLEPKNRSGPNMSPPSDQAPYPRRSPRRLAAPRDLMLAVLEQQGFSSTKRAVFCSLPSAVDTVEMVHPHALVATSCDDPGQVLCDRDSEERPRSRTMISRILISASAGIILFLGSVHLAYTFFTHKFSPTENQLAERSNEIGKTATLANKYAAGAGSPKVANGSER